MNFQLKTDDALAQQLVRNLLFLLHPLQKGESSFDGGIDNDGFDFDGDDDDLSINDDATFSSSNRRSLIKITIKIMDHLMSCTTTETESGRHVNVARDLASFTLLTQRLTRRLCARDRGVNSSDFVDFAFLARLLRHSVEELECRKSQLDVARIVGVIDEALRKTLALQDQQNWNVFNDCRKRLINKAA